MLLFDAPVAALANNQAISISLIVQLIEATGVICGGSYAIFKFGRSSNKTDIALDRQVIITTLLKDEIAELKRGVERISEVITQMAVANTRLDAMSLRVSLLDKRYDDLSHGKGFVRSNIGD